MTRITRDPIDAEIRAAINRRRGVRHDNEPPDPKKAAARRRLEEMAEERRIKEQTEWL